MWRPLWYHGALACSDVHRGPTLLSFSSLSHWLALLVLPSRSGWRFSFSQTFHFPRSTFLDQFRSVTVVTATPIWFHYETCLRDKFYRIFAILDLPCCS